VVALFTLIPVLSSGRVPAIAAATQALVDATGAVHGRPASTDSTVVPTPVR
jgi:hypothetical protein